ncbi:SAM-dependent methyltransferase [Luteipulveratus mongoliensis]|uniref:SAM-dependent methyltransferase n=1 Tax=Luteipulveratus mongoliensis TaxID=571913 RepID=A0A0K1JMW1_9MICO|nr:SAM-dependent methyltransferase [Luteipulveratus mongoliensis]AKU18046.1 hypothetical protein VV02_22905 [Luteipulveratus mongoliensis]
MPSQPWESAWQRALYGPHGFYRQDAGPAAHFATSAQGVPGVGSLLARAVSLLARRYDVTHVVEVGAGRGELLSSLHAVDPDLQLHGLDVVERPAVLPADIAWTVSPGGRALPDTPADLTDVLVIAHEWLDVVPMVVAEVGENGSLREVDVDADGNETLGSLVEDADLQWCQRYWPTLGDETIGRRVEVGRTRDGAWDDLCSRVRRGVVIGVDYGHREGDRPAYGTLTGYRDGGQVRPVPDGRCDITAHVAVDSLATSWTTTQRELFAELGLVAAPPAHALASSDPVAYLMALAERSAALAATASPGLGDFWWFAREIGATPTLVE